MSRDEDDRAPAWLRPHGQAWRVTGSAPLHDNPWFSLTHYTAIAPTGRPANYYLQAYKNLAVGVVALHEDATLTLVGQWRFPFNAYSWELPEGGAPHDEDPLEGAKRELREEAGLEAADWRPILSMQLSNSTSDEFCLCYLATGLSPAAAEAEPDETEALAVARVPFREALDAVIGGKIQDAITVASLLRIHHMAVTGEFSAALRQAVLEG
jgi:8-oxo-dGTP pyrophosphatase MutT (NUDIX family)